MLNAADCLKTARELEALGWCVAFHNDSTTTGVRGNPEYWVLVLQEIVEFRAVNAAVSLV